MKTGIELIAEEREDQVKRHDRTIQLDVKYNVNYQLSLVAGLLTYLDPEELDATVEIDNDKLDFSHVCPTDWNEVIFNKMMNKPYKDRLIIAGALIAAEIDRITYVP